MTVLDIPVTTERMEWALLLNPVRQRSLFGGEASAGGGDRRTEFERDYDRVLFAAPVRRLQDKAQVFPLERNDSVRTRLTHSLEVSTVARQLAGNVAGWLREQGEIETDEEQKAIEAIAATGGLLHDLGNPPFGHFGEEVIREWFAGKFESLAGVDDLTEQERCDFLRFEGNAQTLRLVSRLQVLADFHGLNLTAGTLAAACKYMARSDEADSDHEDHGRSKPGWFASENELVERVREATGTGGYRHPITFLIEAADDIVYSMIDLEDGVKKGVLDWGTLREELKLETGEDESVGGLIERAEKRVSGGPLGLRGRARDEALVQALRTLVIHATTAGAFEAFRERYGAIMEREYGGELVDPRNAKLGNGSPDTLTPSLSLKGRVGLVQACKVIGRRHVYGADEVLRREITARRVLHELMDYLWEAAEGFSTQWLDDEGNIRSSAYAAKIYALLSPNYRAVFEHEMEKGRMPGIYCRLQLVADHIAGMTDTYATDLHQELVNGG